MVCWGLGCVFLLGSRSGWEQKVLCALSTPEPALQAGTTVPLVTAEPAPLGDGSVPAVGCGDARGWGVLETPLCLWCWWVEDAGWGLGCAERRFWGGNGWGLGSPLVFLCLTEAENLLPPVPQAQNTEPHGGAHCCCQ